MRTDRCPYFSFTVAEVPVLGHYQPMRLPVHRCALIEAMLERLETHPEGKPLLPSFQYVAADGKPHPHSGPDQKPIHPTHCTRDRLEAQCRSHFMGHLSSFHLDSALPTEPTTEHVSRRE